MPHYREPAFILVLIELYCKHMVRWAQRENWYSGKDPRSI